MSKCAIHKIVCGALVVTTFGVMTGTMEACSFLQINAADGASVIARTMDEDPLVMNFKVTLTPRGKAIRSVSPNGGPGLTYTTRYASVGLPLATAPATPTDAMNEKGLVLSVLVLNSACYPATVPPGKEAHALALVDAPLWLISQFATVAEVKSHLDDVAFWTKDQAPFHMAMYDATGKGIVLEWIKDATTGKSVLKVYDNEVGVLTNDPTFDWQLTNLRNYLNVSAISTHEKQFGALTVTVPNEGSGGFGLPGDMTPVSRFVRLVVQRSQITPSADPTAALAAISHVINNVDVAQGTVICQAKPKLTYDSTGYTTLRDTKNLVYYIRHSSGFNFFKVDCKQLWDLPQIKEMTLAELQKTGLSDVTALLK